MCKFCKTFDVYRDNGDCDKLSNKLWKQKFNPDLVVDDDDTYGCYCKKCGRVICNACL
jgi:hypothetical protein